MEAGRRLEVYGGLVAAARADVGDEQNQREQQSQPEQRKKADNGLFVHIGIGPTSLPRRNC